MNMVTAIPLYEQEARKRNKWKTSKTWKPSNCGLVEFPLCGMFQPSTQFLVTSK